jgi:hypothetical protein
LKIYFPKYRSNALRIMERGTLVTVSYMAIGFFAGASGIYFFERGFHVSAAGLFIVAGILASIAISAALRCGKLDRARQARTRNNTGQIRAWWDYRPRHGSQRHAESQGAEPVDALSATDLATHIEDTVWFDFIPIESTATEEPTNSPTPKPYD